MATINLRHGSLIGEFRGDNVEGIINGILTDLVQDSSELLDEIGQKVVLVSIRKNFEEEGRPEKWADLTPRTQRERVAEGYGANSPKLQRTGELKRSVTEKSNAMYELDKHSLKITNYLIKGIRNDKGDELAGLVARPFFFLQKGDERDAERVGIKYVQKKVAEIVSANRRSLF